ncbi:MAG TPA: DUF6157 family protein [Candidatus Defluviicoccus seviourii]|nr:DUF6157 family protein [Candidatus Defluviicoccus seviourii]
MKTTNYHETLITPSDDSKRMQSAVPERPGTVAALQYELLAAAPYGMTSDDLIWRAHVLRNEAADTEAARAAFFAKGQPCLRASPLVRSYGWGIHHDTKGRIALIACESSDFARLLADPSVTKRPGMRSSRRA